MEKISKRGVIILIAVIVIICTVSVVAYFIGRANQSTDGRTGSELERAADINRELADEQRRTIENNQRAIEFAENIRGITEETNSALRQLGELNRRSSDIPALVRAETALLANYYWSISHIVSDYFDNMGSE